MFVYKHTETMQYVKKTYFLRKIQTLQRITRQFLGIGMQNF